MQIYSYEGAWHDGVSAIVQNEEALQKKRFGSFGQLVSSMRQLIQISEEQGVYEVHKDLVPVPKEIVSTLFVLGHFIPIRPSVIVL